MGRQHKARSWWAAIPPAQRREIKARQQRDNAARLREQVRRDNPGSAGPGPAKNGASR